LEKLHDLKCRICSFENLLGAYNDAAKEKRYRDEVLAFTLNLEANLFDIQCDLINMTYAVGRYRSFYVQYPKPRLVMALGFRDRVVQWAIYRQINPFIDKRFIDHTYGCRERKGTLAAAQQVFSWVQLVSRKPDAKEWRIIKADVSKFFYRVDHEIILDIYDDVTDDAWFAWLIDTIINNPDMPFGLPEGASATDCPPDRRLYEVGMPIGNLTSQETANMYLNPLDQYCKHTLKLHFYDRYMDDVIALVRGQETAEETRGLMEDFMRRELKLSMSKKTAIYPALQGCEFVGCRITPHGIRPRKQTTKHMKRSLKEVMNQYSDGEITLERALNTVHSHMGLMEHKNGYNMRRWISENVYFQRREAEENE